MGGHSGGTAPPAGVHLSASEVLVVELQLLHVLSLEVYRWGSPPPSPHPQMQGLPGSWAGGLTGALTPGGQGGSTQPRVLRGLSPHLPVTWAPPRLGFLLCEVTVPAAENRGRAALPHVRRWGRGCRGPPRPTREEGSHASLWGLRDRGTCIQSQPKTPGLTFGVRRGLQGRGAMLVDAW